MTNTENTAGLPEKSDIGQVLKSDTLGRMRTPVERRKELLAEFERSGLSGKKFAALVGVKYSTFAFWLQQRRRKAASAAKPTDTVRWLEAVVEKAQDGAKASIIKSRRWCSTASRNGSPTSDRPHSGGKTGLALVVELPAGARLEIHDVRQAQLAAALLRSLESPQPSPC
jgi:hypothetical protein